ncbi:DUF1127 domain-containing protein [Bradyrhizobium sp. RDT46]|uniref:DUF1127 domain-containing protein n=1 Tax=Bradyrhizobium sp. RDT46 TaxID=3341829 RepID=UPI0035C6D52D
MLITKSISRCCFALPLAIVRLGREVSKWRCRRRQRAQLWKMSDRELCDIRLSRADAWAECQKPCWRR